MADQKRGDDAANHASKTTAVDRSEKPASKRPPSARQDAPNDRNRGDGGLAQPVDALNAANDE